MADEGNNNRSLNKDNSQRLIHNLLKQALHLHKSTVRELEGKISEMRTELDLQRKTEVACTMCPKLQQSIANVTEAYQKAVEVRDATIVQLKNKVSELSNNQSVKTSPKKSLKLNKDGLKHKRHLESNPTLNSDNFLDCSPSDTFSCESSEEIVTTDNKQAIHSTVNHEDILPIVADTCAPENVPDNFGKFPETSAKTLWKKPKSIGNVTIPETVDMSELNMSDLPNFAQDIPFTSTPVSVYNKNPKFDDHINPQDMDDINFLTQQNLNKLTQIPAIEPNQSSVIQQENRGLKDHKRKKVVEEEIVISSNAQDIMNEVSNKKDIDKKAFLQAGQLKSDLPDDIDSSPSLLKDSLHKSKQEDKVLIEDSYTEEKDIKYLSTRIKGKKNDLKQTTLTQVLNVSLERLSSTVFEKKRKIDALDDDYFNAKTTRNLKSKGNGDLWNQNGRDNISESKTKTETESIPISGNLKVNYIDDVGLQTMTDGIEDGGEFVDFAENLNKNTATENETKVNLLNSGRSEEISIDDMSKITNKKRLNKEFVLREFRNEMNNVHEFTANFETHRPDDNTTKLTRNGITLTGNNFAYDPVMEPETCVTTSLSSNQLSEKIKPQIQGTNGATSRTPGGNCDKLSVAVCPKKEICEVDEGSQVDSDHILNFLEDMENSPPKDIEEHSYVFTSNHGPNKSPLKDNDDEMKIPFNDSFDKVPKPVSRSYAHSAVVRKRVERKKLDAFDCAECSKYYKGQGLTDSQMKEKMRACSRHRGNYEIPSTPDGFWKIGFPTTQECVQKGYTKFDSQPGPSKFRRKRQLTKHFATRTDSNASQDQDS